MEKKNKSRVGTVCAGSRQEWRLPEQSYFGEGSLIQYTGAPTCAPNSVSLFTLDTSVELFRLPAASAAWLSDGPPSPPPPKRGTFYALSVSMRCPFARLFGWLWFVGWVLLFFLFPLGYRILLMHCLASLDWPARQFAIVIAA